MTVAMAMVPGDLGQSQGPGIGPWWGLGGLTCVKWDLIDTWADAMGVVGMVGVAGVVGPGGRGGHGVTGG